MPAEAQARPVSTDYAIYGFGLSLGWVKKLRIKDYTKYFGLSSCFFRKQNCVRISARLMSVTPKTSIGSC
jgi:hypothetical protein